jgi:hypothetical protein
MGAIRAAITDPRLFGKEVNRDSPRAECTAALLRHFIDLRDGTHGGVTSRRAGSHHPHLQGGTVGDWPLNVFDEEQASALLPTLRDIASAEIHNLVFQADYRLVFRPSWPDTDLDEPRWRRAGSSLGVLIAALDNRSHV